MKEKILEAIREVEEENDKVIVFPLNYLTRIEEVIHDIDQNIGFSFSVYLRSSVEGDDHWLQVEYYSLKIGKTIIWDYGFYENFKDMNELAEVLADTEKEVVEFEAKLPLLTKVIV